MYYEVKGTNLRILGTIHMLPAGLKEIPKWASEAIDWSQDLIVESDPAEAVGSLRLPEGSTLDNRLPKEVFDRLKVAWGDAPSGIPLNSMKPWAPIFGLAYRLFPIGPGLEVRYRERCDGVNRKVYWLEKGADFCARLDAIPDSIYIEMTDEALNRLPEIRAKIPAMMEAWLRGDLDGIWAFSQEMPLFKFAVLRKALLTDRNQAWMSSVRLAVKAHRKTLLAVGCIHLCGENSLPDIMGKEGHALVPIPLA